MKLYIRILKKNVDDLAEMDHFNTNFYKACIYNPFPCNVNLIKKYLAL